MEKPVLNPNFLFFHMGPGFHAKIEASAFQTKYPHVAFLDQPFGVDYNGLLDWAEQQIQFYSISSSEPLTLLGHSFGGAIIRDVLPRVADKVGEIRLLNSAFDPFDCFVNLQQVLKIGGFDYAYWRSQAVADKMKLIFEVAQHPQMADAYWLNPEAKKSYEARAALFPPLHIESFVAVFSSFLVRENNPEFKWQGKSEILYSLADNLLLRTEVVAPWVTPFPQAQFIELGATGHYAHFESVAAEEIFFRKREK